MIRTLAGCMVAGALLCGAPPFAAAQENSFGFIYTPSLSMHDESACCSAAGAWLSVGRLHVEHVVAWDSKWQKLAAEWDIPEATTPETVDGHVLTALWTLRSWQAPRFITRFQGGGRYAAPIEPTDESWGFGAGLTVDISSGRPSCTAHFASCSRQRLSFGSALVFGSESAVRTGLIAA